MQSKLTSLNRNVLAGIVSQIVLFISGIIVPRLILLNYGSEYNGISGSVSQIVSYASLIEVGLSLASIQTLYAYLAKNDVFSRNGVLSTAKDYFKKTGLFFLIIVIISGILFSSFAQSTLPSIQIFILVLIISMPKVFEYFFHAKYRILLTADQKLYVVSISQSISLIVGTMLKVFLIMMGWNIALVFAITFIIEIVRIYCIALYVKKKYPTVKFNEVRNREAMSKRSSLVVHQLSGLVVNSSGAILIALIFDNGLLLASVYTVYNLVFKNMYLLITNTFSNGAISIFGQSYYSDELTVFKHHFRLYETSYYAIISVLYSVMGVLILPFIRLYTRGVTDVNYDIPAFAFLFFTSAVLNVTRVPCGMIINATGHFNETKNRAIIEALINLVVFIVFVWEFEIYAIFFASIASYLYRVNDIIVYTNKHILKSKPMISYIKVLSFYSIIIALYYLNNYLDFIFIQSWLEWIIYASIMTFIASIMVFFLNFAINKKDMFHIFDVFKKHLKKHKK